MEFRILGPFEVVLDGRVVEIGGHRQRMLLAVMLLRANEVVSRERLIDELWGNAAPPGASQTLTANVSRLRKALAETTDEAGAGILETRGRGYVLRVDPEQLDARRFESMLAAARAALAEGDAGPAQAQLADALALWRGPALADFAYDPFAQTEAARLEELRLVAHEERIDIGLLQGRHDELVAELEALVARHPLRERVRGQLMLGLYRAGRQAEALQVYRSGRQALAQELGLEPSPGLRDLERRILEQDATLAGPVAVAGRPAPTASMSVPGTPPWRRPRILALGGAFLVAVALGTGWLLSGRATTVQGAGAIVIDPAAGDVVDSVALGTAPSNVTLAPDGVWVIDADARTVTKIARGERAVERTLSVGTPTDVLAAASAIWLANGTTDNVSAFPASVTRLDPGSGEPDVTIPLPDAPGGHERVLPGIARQYLAATAEAIWVVNRQQTVSRIDPRTNRVVANVDGVRAENVAAGEGDVWVSEGSTLAQIDPSVNEVVRRIGVDADLTALAVGAGSVWAVDPAEGTVWRIDVEPTVRKTPIDVAQWVADVAFGAGAAWATNEIADEVYRIDPRTNDVSVVGRTHAPRDVAAEEDGVWVTAAAPPSEAEPLPAGVCGDLVYGGAGAPDVLLVSDLPLKGDVRRDTQPMQQAIRLVLEQRGWAAGATTVGYRSCDSSTAQSGSSDFFRCALNGKAYARALDVVAVLGSYFSFCTFAQLPITSAAPEGPVATLSPTNTDPILTGDESLYPSGIRHYARLPGDQALQAAGHALLAQQLGARRIVALRPRGDDEFGAFARDVETAAKSLGLQVARGAAYDAEGTAFTAFARAVARQRPDAVSVAGILLPGTGALLRDLRAALPGDVPIVVPDGFYIVDDLVALTRGATDGLYVTYPQLANEALPPRGRQFLAALAAEDGSLPASDFTAAYAAQAAEILLDAIARSDGSRSSVTAELMRTRVAGGLVGRVAFDPVGEVLEGGITAYRVAGRAFVVDRVVEARRALLDKS